MLRHQLSNILLWVNFYFWPYHLLFFKNNTVGGGAQITLNRKHCLRLNDSCAILSLLLEFLQCIQNASLQMAGSLTSSSPCTCERYRKKTLMHILIQATFYRKFARASVQEKQQVEMPSSHLDVWIGHQRTPDRTANHLQYGANREHWKVTWHSNLWLVL